MFSLPLVEPSPAGSFSFIPPGFQISVSTLMILSMKEIMCVVLTGLKNDKKTQQKHLCRNICADRVASSVPRTVFRGES